MSFIFWLVLIFTGFFNPLRASGWDNPIMGLRSLSMNTAFTALADDPSAIYHNPAGIVQCSEGWTVQAEGVYVMPHHFAHLKKGVNAESQWRNLLPQGFFVLRQKKAAFGLGIYVPYGGGGIDYSKNELGEAIKAYLGVLAVSGVLSKTLGENLMVGGGISLLNAQNKAKVVNQQGETDILERGKSWSIAGGAIWKTSGKFRIGFSYKGPSKITLKGNAHIPISDDTFPSETRINLPYSLSLGFLWKYSKRSTFTLDIQTTSWSVLDSVRGKIFIPGFVGGYPKGEALGFHNVLKAMMGTEWWISHKISLRGGAAYDPAAAEAMYLTPTNIDVNKVALSFGIGYLLGSSQINFTLVKMSGRQRKVASGEEPGTYNLKAILVGAGGIFAF